MPRRRSTTHSQQRRRAGCAVAALVPFPVAEHVGIGGEHQRLVASPRRALHDVAPDGALLHDVQLHPQPPTGARGDLLEARGRDGAESVGDAELCRSARQRDIAVSVQQPVEAGRRNDERGVGCAAENRRAQVTVRGVHERLRDEPQPLERLAVAAQRHFLFGATFDVFEHEARYAAAGDIA